jgi:hypothetical protein
VSYVGRSSVEKTRLGAKILKFGDVEVPGIIRKIPVGLGDCSAATGKGRSRRAKPAAATPIINACAQAGLTWQAEFTPAASSRLPSTLCTASQTLSSHEC